MTFTEPAQCPFYLISRLSLQVTAVLKKELATAGFTHVRPAYLSVLLCLWQQDGRIVTDLARCARLEPSTMTGLLDRMERDGLVCRTPAPNDRRAHLICLTDNGRAARKPAWQITQNVLARAFSGIEPEELDQAMDVLQRALVNIAEENNI